MLCLIACRNKNPNRNYDTWTNEEKWNYFVDSIAKKNMCANRSIFSPEPDSLNDFEVFARVLLSDIKAKNIKDPIIYALEEPYIDTTSIDKKKKWLRITVEGSRIWPSRCVIAELKNNKTYLTYKELYQNECEFCGLLDFSFTKILPDTVFKDIEKKLVELNFWILGADTANFPSRDGEQYIFEAIDEGKYNLASRCSPTNSGNNTTMSLFKMEQDMLTIINSFQHMAIEHNNKVRLDSLNRNKQ